VGKIRESGLFVGTKAGLLSIVTFRRRDAVGGLELEKQL